MAVLLGIDADLKRFHTFGAARAPKTLKDLSAAQRADVVNFFRARMIRHTKSQRIGGDVALALSHLQSETHWLDMTRAEAEKYEQDGILMKHLELSVRPANRKVATTPPQLKSDDGAKAFWIENRKYLSMQISQCLRFLPALTLATFACGART